MFFLCKLETTVREKASGIRGLPLMLSFSQGLKPYVGCSPMAANSYIFYPPLICIYNNRVSPVPDKRCLFSLGISLLAASLLVSEHLAPCLHPFVTSRCLVRRLHTYFGAHIFCDYLGRLLLQFLSSLPMRMPQVLGHHFFLASKAHTKYKQMLLWG